MINALTLRKRRQRLGMTQKELAEALGVTQPFVSRCERGIAIQYPVMFDLALSFLEQQADEREARR